MERLVKSIRNHLSALDGNFQIVKGIVFTAGSPIEGLYRGFNGDNTPVPYRKIGVIRDVKGARYFEDTVDGFVGSILNFYGGSFLGGLAWSIPRSILFYFEIVSGHYINDTSKLSNRNKF